MATLTQQQLQSKIQELKSKGLDDNYISSKIQSEINSGRLVIGSQQQAPQVTQNDSLNVSQKGSQDLSSSTGNFLINLLKGMAQPFTNTAKRVGGAVYEIGANRAGDVRKAGDLNTQAQEAISRGDYQTARSLLDQAVLAGQQGAKTNPFLKTTEEMQSASDPMQIAKDSAGILAYGVPMGAVSKAGIFGRGALSGGLFGFGQSGKTPESMIGSTALGALSGGAGALLLSKVLGGAGSKLVEKGTGIRQGVVKPKVTASPFMAEDEAMITKTLGKLGMKGSAEIQKKQMPTVFRSLTSKISSILDKSKGKIEISQLNDEITNALDNNINVDITDPVQQKALNKVLTLVTKQVEKSGGTKGNIAIKSIRDALASSRSADEFANKITSLVPDKGKNLAVKDLFLVKQELGNQLSRVFTKVDKGTPLTASEEVALTAWGSIDDILTKIEPAVKDLTKTQSYLYKAAPGLASSAKQTIGIPFVGSRVGAGGLQTAKDATGRALQGTGGLLDKALEQVPKGVLAKTGAFGGAGVLTVKKDATPPLNGSVSFEEEMGNIPSMDEYEAYVSTDTDGEEEGITAQQVSMAHLMLDPKEAKKIESAYNIQQDRIKEGKGSAEVQKQKRSKEVTERILTQLEDLYFKNALYGGKRGVGARIGGASQKLGAALGYNEPLKIYEGIRMSSRPLLARAAGDVGNLAIQEQEAAVMAIPDAGSTLGEALLGFSEARKKFGVPTRKIVVE